jgi:hypothetical protein
LEQPLPFLSFTTAAIEILGQVCGEFLSQDIRWPGYLQKLDKITSKISILQKMAEE